MVGIRPVLILGSGPDAMQASMWNRKNFDSLVAINNAWRVRADWTHAIYPEDFPADRRPQTVDPRIQQVITANEYVPVQNRYGGFVYAGGTMAFTAGYWALGTLRPDVLAFFGCDMVYGGGQTHFYGSGTADPLRDDVTLQSLEAKSARLMALAARQNCLVINLSRQPVSRLVFQRTDIDELAGWGEPNVRAKLSELNDTMDHGRISKALEMEQRLGYMSGSGRYWQELERFDAEALHEVDELWLESAPAEYLKSANENIISGALDRNRTA